MLKFLLYTPSSSVMRCLLSMSRTVCRKQASLWLQGDMYRARQKELDLASRDHVEVTHILHGMGGININDSKHLNTSMNDSDFEEDAEVNCIYSEDIN